MLSNTVMKNLSFAAWKNSLRPKIGQFELYNKIFWCNSFISVRLTREFEKLPFFLTVYHWVFCLPIDGRAIPKAVLKNSSPV